MSHGDINEAQELIDQILEWAENKSWFDSSFVEDVQDQMWGKGFVTELQIEGLYNIIEKFDI